MYSKTKIYNLALNFLLITRDIKNADTDQSNECKVLNLHWDLGLNTALEEMDLNATAKQEDLTLVTNDPNDLWDKAYKYPTNCALVRRLVTPYTQDNPDTRVEYETGIYGTQKVIFTNEIEAVVSFIPSDLPLSVLSANAALCIAAKLAELSSALIVGKGARELRKDVITKFELYKAKAQAHDMKENFKYINPHFESDLVRARIE